MAVQSWSGLCNFILWALSDEVLNNGKNIWEQWKTQGQWSLLQFYTFPSISPTLEKSSSWSSSDPVLSASVLVLVNLWFFHSLGFWCFCLYFTNALKFDNCCSFPSINHCSQLLGTEIWMCLMTLSNFCDSWKLPYLLLSTYSTGFYITVTQ